MKLRSIQTQNFRNLAAGEIAPGDGLSVFWGGNGAGKTSLLEAIYLLGRGRSFRGTKVLPLIRFGATELTVFGELEHEQGRVCRIGIRKFGQGSSVRVDGKNIRALSELASMVPLVAVTPSSLSLIEGGPVIRRRFLDWGMFHVEPDIRRTIVNYEKALHQRNALLRGGSARLGPWEAVLAESGQRISEQRVHYVDELRTVVSRTLARFPGMPPVDLEFQQGWGEGEGLETFFGSRRAIDARAGYTTRGPHRDTLRICAGGKPLAHILSRGQQKLVALVLVIGQGVLLEEQTGRVPLGLVDDFDSELDRENRDLALGMLRDLGWQFMLTSVNREFPRSVSHADSRMFHVEHGRVSLVG